MIPKNEIQGALLKKGVNLTELCKRLRMSNGTLSKRLHGDSEWKLSELQAIAEIIGTDELVNIFFDRNAS